jgi:hypothetical protein
MEIYLGSTDRMIEPRSTVSHRPALRSASDGALFAETDALNRLLERVPAVRAERLEQVRQYAFNAAYPPVEVLRDVAELLAVQMRGDSEDDKD